MIKRIILICLLCLCFIHPCYAAEPTYDIVDDLFDMETKTVIAKIIWGEARGIRSQTEQSAIVWTILNRCDAWDRDILDVALQPNQFAYSASNKTTDDYGRSLLDLASDVLIRWATDGEGRTLPKEYLYYGGNGKHNKFRIEYKNPKKLYWDWSLESPYET